MSYNNGDDNGLGLPEGEHALSEDQQRAVDELGRRMGAELRRPAPAGGVQAVIRRVHAHRLVMGAIGVGAVLVLVVVGIVVFAGDDGSDGLKPADNTVSATTESSATTVEATVEATVVETTMDEAGPSTAPGLPTSTLPPGTSVWFDLANGLDDEYYTPTALWRLTSQQGASGQVARLVIEEFDPDTGVRRAEQSIDALRMADVLRSFPHAQALGDNDFSSLGITPFVGVAGHTIVLRDTDVIIGIDADTAEINIVPIPTDGSVGGSLDPSNPAPAYVGTVGDTVLVVIGNVVSRADLDSGTFDLLATLATSETPEVVFGPDALWLYTAPRDGTPSVAARVDTDGSFRELGRVGKVFTFGFYPGSGLLWAIASDPSDVVDAPNFFSVANAVVGLDRSDGHVVTVLPPQPASVHFQLFAFRDGLFAATCDDCQTDLRWSWIGNDGVITTLSPRPELTPVGVAGERLVLHDASGALVTIPVSELLAG